MNIYILLFLSAPICHLLLEYGLDRIRIQRDLKQHQCQLTKLTRKFDLPLTLFFKKRQREYQVIYQDKIGQELKAVCHTELFEGVFWTAGVFPKDDAPEPQIDFSSLQEKVHALQQQIHHQKLTHQEQKKILETEIQDLEAQLARFRS